MIDSGAVTVLRVREGDVVVFRTSEKLTQKQQRDVAVVLEEHFGDTPTLILHNGQEIAVVQPDPPWWRRIFGRRRG